MPAPSIPLDSWWQNALSTLPPSSYQAGQTYFETDVSITPVEDHTNITPAVHPLHQWGLISITGADASSFLQGQLTADIEALNSGSTTLAAHCDPKGRMHSSFYLHCSTTNQYLLQLPRAVISTALAALQKYAVFSKVTLVDISNQYAGFGLSDITTTQHDIINDHAALFASIDMPAIGSTQWIKKENFDNFLKTISTTDLCWRGSAVWEWRIINAGIGFVQQQTIGEFIPQMLNFDYLGGISFTKGCYTGQEIIARMKYRGKVKRRCLPFTTTSISTVNHKPILPGYELVDDNGKIVGTVVNAIESSSSVSPIHTYGLAVVKMDVLGNSGHSNIRVISPANAIDVDDQTQTFTITAPPYAINNDSQ